MLSTNTIDVKIGVIQLTGNGALGIGAVVLIVLIFALSRHFRRRA